jgi:hypothetical protein
MEEKKRPFGAGLALGAALNVKLMPVILIPPLLSQCRSRRDLARCSAGLTLAGLPFVPFLLTSGRAMYKNMIAYNSLQLDWGINAFLNAGFATELIRSYVLQIRAVFLPSGRYLIIVIVCLLSAVVWYKRRRFGYQIGAIAWATFLILTPGYGVQYAVCVLPLLFAADFGRATIYSLTAGIMLFVVYAAQLNFVFPLHANVQYYPYPPIGILFGLIAWIVLVDFLYVNFIAIWRLKP